MCGLKAAYGTVLKLLLVGGANEEGKLETSCRLVIYLISLPNAIITDNITEFETRLSAYRSRDAHALLLKLTRLL
jgi:hypothetical protein